MKKNILKHKTEIAVFTLAIFITLVIRNCVLLTYFSEYKDEIFLLDFFIAGIMLPSGLHLISGELHFSCTLQCILWCLVAIMLKGIISNKEAVIFIIANIIGYISYRIYKIIQDKNLLLKKKIDINEYI